MSVIEQEFQAIAEAAARRILDAELAAAVAREMSRLVNGQSEEAQTMRRIAALEYLTKREAATLLNVSEAHIDNLIADDPTFPISRVGRVPRIRRVELIEWCREQGRRRPRPVRSQKP